MKKLSVHEQSYTRDVDQALFTKKKKNFYNIIGKHAASMIKLALHNHAEKKRDLMTWWLKVDQVNNDWIGLLCPVLECGTPTFYNVCSRLIKGYSDLLGDYIVERAVKKEQFDDVADVSAKFYDKLSSLQQKREIKDMWKQYTASIVDMAHELEQHGSKSDNFFIKARECIIAGNLLGSKLDYALFY